MITEKIFPLTARRDLSKISADRRTIDFKTYADCLAALEWAEDYIKNGKLIGLDTRFMDVRKSSPEAQ